MWFITKTGEGVTTMWPDIDLTTRVAVVTGGNSGLGKETVRVLAKAGMKVIFSCRSMQTGEAVVAEIMADDPQAKLTAVIMDLTDLVSIQDFAARVGQEERIDAVILNAGVMMTPQTYTECGWELQIATNHHGHFYLVQLLADKLNSQVIQSRLVVVSSVGHVFGNLDPTDLHWKRRKYSSVKAYANSKIANVLFAAEYRRRYPNSRVTALSLHPGSIAATELTRHFGFIAPILRTVGGLFLKSVGQGAATQTFAAVAPELEGRHGAYLCDCAVSKPSKQAQDLQLAAQLWDITEQQVSDALQGKRLD